LSNRMSSSVWVLCPGGRQIKVAVNATKTVLSVIEEACAKVNANPDEFDLVTSVQRRPIDASQQWRFTSIPNNSKLELVPVKKARVTKSLPVRVAIQSPTGRLTGSCLSSRTLYHVCQELKLELPEPDTFPIVSYSGKECALDKTLKQIGVLSGSVLLRVHFRAKTSSDDEHLAELEAIAKEVMTTNEPAPKVQKMSVDEKPTTAPLPQTTSTTLERLPNGAKATFSDFKFPTDSVSVERMETDEKKDERLPCGMKAEFKNFKFDEKPSNSSHQQQERDQRLPNGQRAQFNNFSFDDKPPPAAPATTKTELFPFKDFKFPEKKEMTSTQEQQQPSTSKVSSEENDTSPMAPVIVPVNRDLKVYDNSTGPSVNMVDNLGDDFFEVTVDDLKQMKGGAKKDDNNAPLMTKSLRAAQKRRQMATDYQTHPICRIKFNMPGQITLDIGFHPGETVGDMKEQLKLALVNVKNEKFDVFIAPPKQVLKVESTLWENGLCPRGTCYVTLDKVTVLPELWETRVTPPTPTPSTTCQLTASSAATSSSATTTPPASSTSTKPQTTKACTTSSSSSSKKVPKWFKGTTGKSYK